MLDGCEVTMEMSTVVLGAVIVVSGWMMPAHIAADAASDQTAAAAIAMVQVLDDASTNFGLFAGVLSLFLILQRP